MEGANRQGFNRGFAFLLKWLTQQKVALSQWRHSANSSSQPKVALDNNISNNNNNNKCHEPVGIVGSKVKL